jgi:hypothetical protein
MKTVALRAIGVAAVGSWLAVGPVLAQATGTQGNSSNLSIPTLDGFGLAALAGVLSVGGAWLLSRHRDKQK